MNTEPWKDKDSVKEGSDYAATYVSWRDAVDFCQNLSLQEGAKYRLPTQSEWEYSCRAGTTTAYLFGDDATDLGDYGWFDENAWDVDEKYAHAAGEKFPNAGGLYDLHGNVWEWCNDYPSVHMTDPTGPSESSERVTRTWDKVGRGGNWLRIAQSCRSASRTQCPPILPSNDRGFRVVLIPSDVEDD